MLSSLPRGAIVVHRDVTTLPPIIHARPSMMDDWIYLRPETSTVLLVMARVRLAAWVTPSHHGLNQPPSSPGLIMVSWGEVGDLSVRDPLPAECCHLSLILTLILHDSCIAPPSILWKLKTIAIHLCFPTSECVTTSNNKPHGTRQVSGCCLNNWYFRSKQWAGDIPITMSLVAEESCTVLHPAPDWVNSSLMADPGPWLLAKLPNYSEPDSIRITLHQIRGQGRGNWSLLKFI